MVRPTKEQGRESTLAKCRLVDNGPQIPVRLDCRRGPVRSTRQSTWPATLDTTVDLTPSDRHNCRSGSVRSQVDFTDQQTRVNRRHEPRRSTHACLRKFESRTSKSRCTLYRYSVLNTLYRDTVFLNTLLAVSRNSSTGCDLRDGRFQ